MGKTNEASSSEEFKILKLKKAAMEAMDLRAQRRKPKAMGTQPAMARKKKMKVVKERLPLELLKYMEMHPYKPIDEIPEERLAEESQDFREEYTLKKFVADKLFDYEHALVEQYQAMGYAEDETEVTDNEEEN
ncbi:unnamed protein product [Urochloa humidicola]